MSRSPFLLKFGTTECHCVFTAAILFLSANTAVQAHGIAGARLFPATLVNDDPAVGDELSAPTFLTNSETDYAFEFDKRLTEYFGVEFNDQYRIIHPQGASDLYGWDDPVVTLKYQFFTNAPHEMMASIGLQKEFGGVGATNHGAADGAGYAQPTLYLGKGMGDLPSSLDLLRPLAVTGEFGYQRADEGTQTFSDGGRVRNPNVLNIGFSVFYDLSYLHSQVKDYGLPDFANHLIPIVEFAYSTPASSNHAGSTTTGMIAPGVLYEAQSYQIGVEALIPRTRASGNAVGIIAQLHFYLDDLFPTTIGKPLF